MLNSLYIMFGCVMKVRMPLFNIRPLYGRLKKGKIGWAIGNIDSWWIDCFSAIRPNSWRRHYTIVLTMISNGCNLMVEKIYIRVLGSINRTRAINAMNRNVYGVSLQIMKVIEMLPMREINSWKWWNEKKSKKYMRIYLRR